MSTDNGEMCVSVRRWRRKRRLGRVIARLGVTVAVVSGVVLVASMIWQVLIHTTTSVLGLTAGAVYGAPLGKNDLRSPAGIEVYSSSTWPGISWWFELESGFWLLPIWPLVACGLVIAVLGWVLARAPVPASHCEHCGYNLTGNTSGVCPECGTPTLETLLAQQWHREARSP